MLLINHTNPTFDEVATGNGVFMSISGINDYFCILECDTNQQSCKTFCDSKCQSCLDEYEESNDTTENVVVTVVKALPLLFTFGLPFERSNDIQVSGLRPKHPGGAESILFFWDSVGDKKYASELRLMIEAAEEYAKPLLKKVREYEERALKYYKDRKNRKNWLSLVKRWLRKAQKENSKVFRGYYWLNDDDVKRLPIIDRRLLHIREKMKLMLKKDSTLTWILRGEVNDIHEAMTFFIGRNEELKDYVRASKSHKYGLQLYDQARDEHWKAENTPVMREAYFDRAFQGYGVARTEFTSAADVFSERGYYYEAGLSYYAAGTAATGLGDALNEQGKVGRARIAYEKAVEYFGNAADSFEGFKKISVARNYENTNDVMSAKMACAKVRRGIVAAYVGRRNDALEAFKMAEDAINKINNDKLRESLKVKWQKFKKIHVELKGEFAHVLKQVKVHFAFRNLSENAQREAARNISNNWSRLSMNERLTFEGVETPGQIPIAFITKRAHCLKSGKIAEGTEAKSRKPREERRRERRKSEERRRSQDFLRHNTIK